MRRNAAVIAAATAGGLCVLASPAVAQTSSAASASGDTAWLLSATALVLLMTLPGLALFYAGLVRVKNVLSVMTHCVAIACLASIVWLAAGYSLSFSGTAPLIGDLREAFFPAARSAQRSGVPESLFFMFQMTFAIITPSLIVGAVVERIRFSAVLLFSALWVLAVYAPVAHWVWGGGWLMQRHVMDFAGGLVVHATAGTSALVLAWRLGPRESFPRDLAPPHNPGMTMIGAAMLWVGWFGFNGGSALAANADAASALMATHLAAASAGLVWAAIEWRRFRRPSMVGLVTGIVAGLATVTPASGFIGPAAAVALGAAGSLICYQAVDFVKHRLKIDDSLDVFAVHGVGGMLGSLLVAVLAWSRLGGAGYAPGMGVGEQTVVQLLGLAATVGWSAIVTLGLAFVVQKVVGLRAPSEAIEEGLDMAEHGERAWNP